MYDFSKAFEQVRQNNNYPEGSIYDYISDIDIYYKLLGYYPELKKKYSSPFSKDSDPSFAFIQSNRLLYKCFSTGKAGDAISMVAEFNCLTYKEAILYVYNNYSLSKVPIQSFKYKESTPTKISVVLFDQIPQSFYDYWSKFEISKQTLELYNIKPAKEVWLDKGDGDFLIANYKDNNPVIRYLINGKYKIYQPYNFKNKWLSNTRIVDVQGWIQLPKTGELLIISKALKDIMVWRELGYNAISLSSETANLPKELIENINKRFKRVISFLDCDEAGIRTMIKYYNEYGIEHYQLPEYIDCKDLGEVCEKYDLQIAREIINKIIC